MRVAAFVLCILAASIAQAAGPDRHALENEFKALYERQAELLKQRDVKGWMEFNAPDHSIHLLNGKSISREELEQGMTRFFTSGQLVKQIRFSYTVKEITLRGDEALVLVEQKDKRIQIRKDGNPHEVEANVIHRDTWTRMPEGWKRRLTEEVRQTKFTVDGKRVD
jgi:hypothetical protein